MLNSLERLTMVPSPLLASYSYDNELGYVSMLAETGGLHANYFFSEKKKKERRTNKT